MPRITNPVTPASGRMPRRLFHSLKVRILSAQYFATNSATAIFANSEGCRLISSPGSRKRIQRFAPFTAGKQSAAISNMNDSAIQTTDAFASLR